MYPLYMYNASRYNWIYVTENSLSGPTFSVDVQCADGYETSDTLSATACTTNGPYTINGTCNPYTCTAIPIQLDIV